MHLRYPAQQAMVLLPSHPHFQMRVLRFLRMTLRQRLRIYRMFGSICQEEHQHHGQGKI